MRFIRASAVCVVGFFVCCPAWADGHLIGDAAENPDGTNDQPKEQVEIDNPITATRENDAEIIGAVQTVLSALSLYTLTVDGQWGPASRRALSRFRENEGLPTDGDLPSDSELDLLEQRYDQLKIHGSVWAALDCPGPGCPSQPYSELSAPRSNSVAAARPPDRIGESYEVAQLLPQPQISATPRRTINRNVGVDVFRLDDGRLSIDVVDQLELSVARIHSGTVVAVQCALADLGFLSRQEMNGEVDSVFLLAALNFAQSHGLEFERGSPLGVEFLSELANEHGKHGRSQNCGPPTVRRNTGTAIFR